MNKNNWHKFLSLITWVALMLPIGYQFAHAFEDHEHVVCTAVDVQHIHEQEVDCSFCHVKLRLDSSIPSTDDFFINTTIETSLPQYFIHQKEKSTFTYTTLRGPPQSTI